MRLARELLELVGEHLQVFLFGLMCIGLALASWFLWIDKIAGGDWVSVCGILFGSNAIGGGITEFARSRPARMSGQEKPIQ